MARRVLFPLAGLSTQFGSGNKKLALDASSALPAIGGFDSIPELNGFLHEVSGLLRAVLLAGYQATEVRFDVGSGATVIDPVNRTVRTEGGPLSDELDHLRSLDESVIAIRLVPLPLFGPAVKLPFGLPLSSTAPTTTTAASTPDGELLSIQVHDRGSLEPSTAIVETFGNPRTPDNLARWVAVIGESPDWQSVRARLRLPAGQLAREIAALAFPVVPLGIPLASAVDPQRTGIGAIFSPSLWIHPPTDEEVAAPNKGLLIDAGWKQVEELLQDTTPTADDPDGDGGRVAFVQSEVSNPGMALRDRVNHIEIRDAYEARLTELFETVPPLAADSNSAVDKNLPTTEALLVGIELGLIQPFHSLQLRPTGEETTPREFTLTTLTGSWHSVDNNDVLLINQAGAYIQGHWYVRDGTPSGNRIEEWLVAGYGWHSEYTVGYQMITEDGAGGSPILGDAVASRFVELSDGSPRIRPAMADTVYGTLTVDGAGRIVAVSDDGTEYTFERDRFGAHPTNLLLTLAGLDPRRHAAERSQELHKNERSIRDALIDLCLRRGKEWLDANAGVPKDQVEELLLNEVRAALSAEMNDPNGSGRSDTHDVGYAIGRSLRLELQEMQIDDEIAIHVIHRMVVASNVAPPRTHPLAVIMRLPTSTSGRRYQWKLTDLDVKVVNIVIGGGGRATARFHLREIDASGTEVRVDIVRDVSFAAGTVGATGVGKESGVNSVTEWHDFEWEYDGDLFTTIDGASIDIEVGKASVLGVTKPVIGWWLKIYPADGTTWMQAFVQTAAMPSAKEAWDAGKELNKRRKKPPSTRSKNAFGAYVFWMSGTIGGTAELELAFLRIEGAELTTSSGITSNFGELVHLLDETGLTPLRSLLATCLPLLETPRSTLTVDGHTSTTNPDWPDNNQLLSERRALTIVEAVRNILGPQLGLSPADIVATGHGESAAKGPDGEENPADRRTVLRIGGLVGLWI